MPTIGFMVIGKVGLIDMAEGLQELLFYIGSRESIKDIFLNDSFPSNIEVRTTKKLELGFNRRNQPPMFGRSLGREEALEDFSFHVGLGSAEYV